MRKISPVISNCATPISPSRSIYRNGGNPRNFIAPPQSMKSSTGPTTNRFSRLMRKTAFIVKPAILRTRHKILIGSPRRAAKDQIIAICRFFHNFIVSHHKMFHVKHLWNKSRFMVKFRDLLFVIFALFRGIFIDFGAIAFIANRV